jgi:4a-hydroxytetrahydrobiopterin dehydratase
MASTRAFQFAEGEDAQQLARDAEALLKQGWAQDGEAMGVTKTFHFKSYFKAVVSLFGASRLELPLPLFMLRLGKLTIYYRRSLI